MAQGVINGSVALAHDGAPVAPEADRRVHELFDQRYRDIAVRNDRLLVRLMLIQWAAAVVFALWFSPYAWAGRESVIHGHVYAALFIGAAINSLPLLLARLYPGAQVTRYALGCAQVLWSALLIHLTGGRIETHFHVFCSLAILAFYRDLRIIVPATIVVAVDHFVRGMYWPESVYGVTNPEWWRFLEHAGWVIFLDGFLIYNCVESYRELWRLCEQQVALEDAKESASRMERLAALGQLAASVGHELRNPLAAIRNAHAYIGKRMQKSGDVDPKVKQFSEIISRELEASGKIITNLLDFSRPRAPTRAPCPLGPLVEEAFGLVPSRQNVDLVNEVPEDLPIPDLDKDQFRQILINLVQNAVESIPEGRPGKVVVRAEAEAGTPWRIRIVDTGAGVPPDLIDKIFQPLFSTKVKGTGLGLAVVASMVERHGGSLDVHSEEGRGTTFTIQLPPSSEQRAA